MPALRCESIYFSTKNNIQMIQIICIFLQKNDVYVLQMCFKKIKEFNNLSYNTN